MFQINFSFTLKNHDYEKTSKKKKNAISKGYAQFKPRKRK